MEESSVNILNLSNSVNIFNLSYELQQTGAFVDVILESKEIIQDEPNLVNRFKGQVYQAHQLLLASASPLLKMLFEDHFATYKDASVTVILPEISATAIQSLLTFIYTGDIPATAEARNDALEVASLLQINSLVSILDPNYLNIDNTAYTAVPLILKKRGRKRGSRKPYCRGNKNTLHARAKESIEKRKIKPKYNSDMYELGFSTGNVYNERAEREDSIQIVNESTENNFIDDKNVETEALTSPVTTSNKLNTSVSVISSEGPSNNIIFNSDLQINSNPIYLNQDHKSGRIFFITQNQEMFENVNNTVLNTCTPTDGSEFLSVPLLNSHKLTPDDAKRTDLSTNNSELLPYVTLTQEESLTNQNHSYPELYPSEAEVEKYEAEDEEEKLLKLQVLLKDCEGVDLSNSSNSFALLKEGEKFLREPTELSNDKWTSDDNRKSNEEIEYVEEAVADPSTSDNLTVSNKVDCPITSAKHECHICSRLFNGARTLTHHLKIDHQIVRSCCSVCGKSFKKRSELMIHEARHKKPTLPCEHCGKLFKLKKDLLAHELTHISKKKFKCHICDSPLTSGRNLRQHIRLVHDRRKAFQCGQCQKSYAKKADLMVHVRTVHTGEKPYKCPTCQLSFYSSGQLDYHKDKHLINTSFACKVCPKTYKTRASLFSHARIHKNKRNKEKSLVKGSLLLDNGPYKGFGIKSLKCKLCSDNFTSVDLFETHMREVHKQTVKVAEIKVKPVILTKNFKNITARSSKFIIS